LLFLLLVGILHLFLVWNGDILALYAVCGFVVAPLLGLSTRVLLGLSLLFFIVQVAPITFPPPFATDAELRAHVEAANHVYGYGSFFQVLSFRIAEVRPIGA